MRSRRSWREACWWRLSSTRSLFLLPYSQQARSWQANEVFADGAGIVGMNMTLGRKNRDGKRQHETRRSAPLCFFAIWLASWLWPTVVVGADLQQHRNEQWKFRVSYPQSWKAVPTKGSNVRFAVVSLGDGGNCNVTVIVHPDTITTSQQLLNGDVSDWFLDKRVWPKLVGEDANEVDVLSSRVGAIYGVTALIGSRP